MADVLVLRPGLLSTVQDLGRWGWQAYGISVSGPMDLRAHRLANLLAGNEEDASTIEITMSGPELMFEAERTVAIAGAEFVVTVEGHRVPPAAPFPVPAGARVTVGSRRRGTRAYLAVSGGFAVPPVLGSCSTHVPSGMGGINGRPLLAGDRLVLGPSRPERRSTRHAPAIDMPDGHATLRFMPAASVDAFAPGALAGLQSGRYTVRPESNRMGYRLEGPPIATLATGDRLSQPTMFGSVQVPQDGQPILLMADRQTTGGYPLLGTVITADLGLAGQLGPSDTVAFVACTRQQAIAALIAQERALMTMQ